MTQALKPALVFDDKALLGLTKKIMPRIRLMATTAPMTAPAITPALTPPLLLL